MSKSCPFIQKNEGTTDRIIRIVAGVILLIAGYALLFGILQTVAYIVGIVSLITGATGICGLYSIFSISTKKKS